VKPLALLLCGGIALSLTACHTVTLENRRDLYFPQEVNGPYTRLLKEGLPKVKKTVTVTETVTIDRDYKAVR